MENLDILKLEEQTLSDLYKFSINKIEINRLRNERTTIENEMFEILFNLANSINDIIKKKEMILLKEIIEKHNFLQLATDSKKALESSDRDFIENTAFKVRSFESDLLKLSFLYDIPEYRKIHELENIAEKLKLEYSYRIKNPLPSLLTVLIWNSRTLHNRLSSRAVWLSYKKP